MSRSRSDWSLTDAQGLHGLSFCLAAVSTVEPQCKKIGLWGF